MRCRRLIFGLLLATALATPAAAERPAIGFLEGREVAKQIYAGSHGLQSLGLGLTTKVSDRRARRIVKDLAVGARQKYGLEIRIVSKRARIPGLTSATGDNPAKWDPAANVIYVRAGMPARRFLREVGHEYGTFLLARHFGGRERIPGIGEEPLMFLTHVLDQVIAKDGR